MNLIRDGEQIRIAIPQKVNVRALRLAFLPAVLVISALGAALGVVQIVLSKHHGWAGWSDLICVGLGLISAEILILFTRRTTLTLTSEILVLEKRAGVYKKTTQKFLTEHLHDLQFVKWEPGVDVRNNWNQNEIQFERDGLIHSFAAGISEPEANALINYMMRIFPFPSRRSSNPPERC